MDGGWFVDLMTWAMRLMAVVRASMVWVASNGVGGDGGDGMVSCVAR